MNGEVVTEASVVFYQLTKKFVDSEASIPKDACDVLYYTLAVGHHTGIIDCFERVLSMSLESYRRIVSLFDDHASRYKLEGVMRFGEIEIDKSHIPLLLPSTRAVLSSIDVFDEAGKTIPALSPDDSGLLAEMIDLLVKVRDDPSVYLMVRRMV